MSSLLLQIQFLHLCLHPELIQFPQHQSIPQIQLIAFLALLPLICLVFLPWYLLIKNGRLLYIYLFHIVIYFIFFDRVFNLVVSSSLSDLLFARSISMANSFLRSCAFNLCVMSLNSLNISSLLIKPSPIAS